MNRVAAIITSYNRKDKTLDCLKHLFSALDLYNEKTPHENIQLQVFLTDDGCTDGTAEAIVAAFSNREIKIIHGNGNLFWAGGMRLAWNEALKEKFDCFLLLNDDTNVFPQLFFELFLTQQYCLDKFKKKGIYSGCTCEKGNRLKVTYGGDIRLNKLLATSKRLAPNGVPQLCDMANANILFIPMVIIKEIGIFHEGYTHGIADHDYTIKARKRGIPVLITGTFCGECNNDHNFSYEHFAKMSFNERKQYLNSPKGSAKDYLLYIKRNSILRYPIVYLGFLMKLFFPRIYLLLDKKRTT